MLLHFYTTAFEASEQLVESGAKLLFYLYYGTAILHCYTQGGGRGSCLKVALNLD